VGVVNRSSQRFYRITVIVMGVLIVLALVLSSAPGML
jgi:hypothetical protein